MISGLQTIYKLDKGESEAISLALELIADVWLIDERLGRREASRLGLSITGMLGVLSGGEKAEPGECNPSDCGCADQWGWVSD